MTEKTEPKTVGIDNRIKVVITKGFSTKPDKDSTESKSMTLECTYDCTIKDLVYDNIGKQIIGQQPKIRNKWNNYTEGQVIKATFTGTNVRVQEDPMTAVIARAKAAGIDTNNKEALGEFILTELSKK
jgi:hypothetical protein